MVCRFPVWLNLICLLTRNTSTETMSVRCTRMYTVQGSPEKRNDVIFCGNYQVKPRSNVVFFGGDVQDYSENMLAHADNQRYEKWNLENTAKLLQTRFPKSYIWVIRPSKLQLKTFSVYGNFVESDAGGCPTHSQHYGAWIHLKKLLSSASAQINKMVPEKSGGACTADETSCSNGLNSSDLASPDLPLSIIGFSKGCVVLNQLLYELGHTKKNPELERLVGQVTHMYWLDGGHNGESKTWVADLEVLRGLVGTGIEVRSHVTPYQMRDAMRKWIGQEHKKFVLNLRQLGVTVYDTMHFADEERSLENHFQVLYRF